MVPLTLLSCASLFLVRVRSDPVHLHSFSFRVYFPEGVAAMVYHEAHNMLLLGSCSHCQDEQGVRCGVSGWRLLDAAPFWGPKLGQSIGKVGYLSSLPLDHPSSLPPPTPHPLTSHLTSPHVGGGGGGGVINVHQVYPHAYGFEGGRDPSNLYARLFF
jgi:hypothetical protein